MIMKLLQAAVLVAGGLALGGCPMQQQAKTAAPAKKPAAADYQFPKGNPPAAGLIRGICYSSSEMDTYNNRMLHQQLNVAVLQCQNPDGSRAFVSQYNAYAQKFQGELVSNGSSMTSLARTKRFNLDTVVTEFANRTAQRVTTDNKEFCGRFARALEWANSPQVTSLNQVPPVYDLGPEMNVFPCPPR